MKSQKKITDELRKLAIHKWVSDDIQSLANTLAPKIRGWINYYGNFRISEMQRVFRFLNIRIAKWARKKYKLKTYAKSYGWLKRIISGIRIHLFIGNMDLLRKFVWKSRMTGDCHVRFCERLGVKLPWST